MKHKEKIRTVLTSIQGRFGDSARVIRRTSVFSRTKNGKNTNIAGIRDKWPLFLAVSYPKIKPKGTGTDTSGLLSVFNWIINHIPHVLFGIAALCGVIAIIQRRRDKARQEALREQIAKHEAEAREKQTQQELEDYKHRQFVQQQRALMTDSLRYDILRRDGFRCRLCGSTASDGVKLHVDHIIPVSKGGRTEPGNLRTLCERCNMGKSNKLE